jgi:hypothetical protein
MLRVAGGMLGVRLLVSRATTQSGEMAPQLAVSHGNKSRRGPPEPSRRFVLRGSLLVMR